MRDSNRFTTSRISRLAPFIIVLTVLMLAIAGSISWHEQSFRSQGIVTGRKIQESHAKVLAQPSAAYPHIHLS